MRIYLDLCCFNRPFDDQSQLLIRLQTEAKLAIQEAIRHGAHSLIWSAILDLENACNPDPERFEAVVAWKTLADVKLDATSSIEQTADALTNFGIKPMDALHIASAIEANADLFLTTDKAIIRKMSSNPQMRVMDPIDFVREFDEDIHED